MCFGGDDGGGWLSRGDGWVVAVVVVGTDCWLVDWLVGGGGGGWGW